MLRSSSRCAIAVALVSIPACGDSLEGTTGAGGSGTSSAGASGPGVGGGAPTGGGGTTRSGPDGATTAVDGRRLILEGETFILKGVCWNPVPKGGVQPQGLDFAGFVEQDAALMAEAGINAVRTYEPITDPEVLDVLYARGIYVLNTVYIVGSDPVDIVDDRIAAVQDHPAVAFWVVGNEWNYNNLYSGLTAAEAEQRVEEVAARIQTLDDRPVMTIYGETPPAAVVDALPSVDVWGLNIYAGLTLNDAFGKWEARSDKPMFLGEYGADAYDATLPGENLEAQALATTTLTQLIIDHDITNRGVASGGTIFEWADEWWKDSGGSPDTQDTGGIAPGGGPHPDATFHEEWWGLVDIDRVPRPAYEALQELYLP